MSKQAMFPTFYAVGYLLRWLWRAIRPLLVVGALVLLAGYVYLNVTSGRALESELAQIQSKGEPLSLHEAAPPTVPESENAAPLYEAAFRHLPRLVQPRPASGNGQPQLPDGDQRVLRHLFDYANDPHNRPERVSTQQISEVLAGTDTALALYRKAAAVPRCRFPVDWEAGAGALFPHYPKLVALTRLTGAHAIFSASEGRTDEAMADLTAVVGMARHFAGEPVMIGQLVQYQCLSIAGYSLQRLLETASPSPDACRRLDQQLADLDLDGPFERAVEVERCFGLWGFDVISGSDPAKLPGMLGVDDPILWLSARLGPLGRPMIRVDEVLYLRSMAQQVERAKRRELPTPAEREASEVQFPWYAPLTRILLPASERLGERRDETRARLALARWGLAISIYHQQKGRYPSHLEDAERAAGWSLPDDPLSGRELIYRPSGAGYLLYSVGINGRDDGGKGVNDRRGPYPSGWGVAPDDLVWRCSTAPEVRDSR